MNIELIQNAKEYGNCNEMGQEFTSLLNGQKDLDDQLQLFRKECEAYHKHQRKRRRMRYYNLALMAKVERNTTQEEVKRLLKCNTRTFLVDVVSHKAHEVEDLILMIRKVQNEHQSEVPNIKLAIGVVLQINGDACRIGRLHKNFALTLERGDTMTLTTNSAYRYTCFKEISFVTNLQYYLPDIKLNDEISIGQVVRGVVVKKLQSAVAIRIEDRGFVNSYDLIDLPNQCYSVEAPSFIDMFNVDLEVASSLNVDFVAVSYIRSLSLLKILRHKIKKNYKLNLIGCIDLEYISSNNIDVMEIIKNLDYLWLTKLFINNNQTTNSILLQDIFPAAKCLKKSVIGSVPLQRYNDFKKFENHEFLWKIDCIFIEKSAWCNKYPLIVKKLLPIKDYRFAVVENTKVMHDILFNIRSIVNFIIRTISSLECQAIFLHTKCETAAKALSRVEIYCPVFVMLPLEEDLECNKEKIDCIVQLYKNLNLRRNLIPVLYTKDMNEYDYKPIDYGIEYARQCCLLETGDFIITLEVGKENGNEEIQQAFGDDVVLLRATYVPPLKIGEKIKCT